MKEFSGVEKAIIVVLVGFWYFVLVAWVYKILALISEGLASIAVFIAVVAFVWFVFFEREEPRS